MTISLIIVTLCGLSTTILAQTDSTGRWFSRSALPTPRQEVAHAVLHGKIYIPGGLAIGGVGSAVVEVFDPKTNTWSTVSPLPEPLHHLGLAVANEKLYVFGGYAGNSFSPTNHVYEFLPDSNIWKQKTSMPVARGAHVALEFSGKIYVIGGVQSGVGVTGRNDVYDPINDSWENRASMPTPREHLAGAVVDSLIYIVGGRSGSGNKNTLEAYSPKSNMWYTKTSMPTARGGLAAASLNGRLYAFGGEIPGVYPQNEEYDPVSDSWRTMTPMPTPRHGIGAATIEDTIFIIGGANVQGFGVTDVNEGFTLSSEISVTQALDKYWNLVSIPVKVNDPRKDTLFPSASSSAYEFNMQGGYFQRDTLQIGVGYWLKFPSADTVTIVGEERLRDTIDVIEGWNLVGTLSVPAPATLITTIPSGILVSSFFGYNGSYQVADTLYPIQGYWIKVSETGKLILNANSD